MGSCACGYVGGGSGWHGFGGGDAGPRYRRTSASAAVTCNVKSWRSREQSSHLLVILIRGGDTIYLLDSLTLTQSSCLRESANACSARFRFFDCWARMLWVEVRLSPSEQGGEMEVVVLYLFQGLVHNVPSRCDLFLLTDSVDAV